jgi:hypothetical protein
VWACGAFAAASAIPGSGERAEGATKTASMDVTDCVAAVAALRPNAAAAAVQENGLDGGSSTLVDPAVAGAASAGPADDAVGSGDAKRARFWEVPALPSPRLTVSTVMASASASVQPASWGGTAASSSPSSVHAAGEACTAAALRDALATRAAKEMDFTTGLGLVMGATVDPKEAGVAAAEGGARRTAATNLRGFAASAVAAAPLARGVQSSLDVM